MMPTCAEIITRALRKARVYAAGEAPSDEDMSDGLDELQNLYEQWGTGGMFGALTDVLTSSDYDALPNQRVTVTDGAVVMLPGTVDRDEGELTPYDVAFLEVIDQDASSVTRYLYENGNWIETSGLALTDEAPLSGRGRSGLAACLALSFAEEFGAQVGPGVIRQAAAFKTGLSLKLGSEAQRTAPEYY